MAIIKEMDMAAMRTICTTTFTGGPQPYTVKAGQKLYTYTIYERS